MRSHLNRPRISHILLIKSIIMIHRVNPLLPRWLHRNLKRPRLFLPPHPSIKRSIIPWILKLISITLNLSVDSFQLLIHIRYSLNFSLICFSLLAVSRLGFLDFQVKLISNTSLLRAIVRIEPPLRVDSVFYAFSSDDFRSPWVSALSWVSLSPFCVRSKSEASDFGWDA